MFNMFKYKCVLRWQEYLYMFQYMIDLKILLQ
jgi:hypothetical protein